MRGGGEEPVPTAAEIFPLCRNLLNHAGLKLFDSAVNCLRRSSSDREPWSLYVSIDPRFSAPRSTNAFRAMCRTRVSARFIFAGTRAKRQKRSEHNTII